MDKKVEAKFNTEGLIKTTDKRLDSLNPQQKVQLNRKGNELFNAGKFSEAEKIFKATGYSDGLSRIGDRYLSNNEFLKALKLFLLAHNKRKSEPLIEKIAKTIEFLIKEDNLK